MRCFVIKVTSCLLLVRDCIDSILLALSLLFYEMVLEMLCLSLSLEGTMENHRYKCI